MEPLGEIVQKSTRTTGNTNDVRLNHIFSRIINQYYQTVSTVVKDELTLNDMCQRQKKLLQLLTYYNTFKTDDFIGILIYMNRLQSIPIENYLDHQNLYYIVLAVAILYSKMYHEENYENSFYANWTKVSLRILNWTEVNILRSLHMMISEEEFEKVSEEISDEALFDIV